ncbi:hypothetical protein MYK68_17030 [Gordonia sp. PP30]|uniref:hypothetical protein n=1 Tax=Gordonia sp. PP30 TaxID=2935861 RepID=UPI001FFF6F50|nr:hypothetical protein [Gordonia sp. PP30]UQE74405.1 hypothetical protein MYK68_17030 [Gordonia sp. PP30]
MRRLLAAAASALPLLALTACDRSPHDDAHPAASTVVSVVTETTGDAPSPQASEVPTSTSRDRSDDVATPIDADAYALAGYHYFTSHSGRWTCAIMVGEQDLRVAGCHGPLPADAPRVPQAGAPDQLGPPNAIEVGASGPGEFTQHGDPAFLPGGGTPGATGKVLPYDRSLTVGPFTCILGRTSGVTCRNNDSGHGFTVSDTIYQLF